MPPHRPAPHEPCSHNRYFRNARNVISTSSGLSSINKMSVPFVMPWPFAGKKECGTLVHLTFSPYPPVMAPDNALDDGQSYSGAFEILFPMQPLKHLEQLVRICHIESNAVVLDVR